MPAAWPDLLPTVRRVRAKYGPLVSADECTAMCNEVAWIHRADGFGLLSKNYGNSGKQPRTGIESSVDRCTVLGA